MEERLQSSSGPTQCSAVNEKHALPADGCGRSPDQLLISLEILSTFALLRASVSSSVQWG